MGQFTGELVNLNWNLKVDTLDADIKSLKKASRQTVMPEILRRINQIIETKLIEIKKILFIGVIILLLNFKRERLFVTRY